MLDVDYFSSHHALIEAPEVVAVRDQPRLGGERARAVQRPRALAGERRAARRGASSGSR
jgi:hypothetical protein